MDKRADERRKKQPDPRKKRRRPPTAQRQQPPKRRRPPQKRSSQSARRQQPSKGRRPPQSAQRQPGRRRKKKRRIGLLPKLLVVVLIIYLVHSYVDQSIRLSKLRQEKENLEAQKVILVKEIDGLKEDYANKDSLEFVEKVAREKLGMIKSNEQVYVDINHSPNARRNKRSLDFSFFIAFAEKYPFSLTNGELSFILYS